MEPELNNIAFQTIISHMLNSIATCLPSCEISASLCTICKESQALLDPILMERKKFRIALALTSKRPPGELIMILQEFVQFSEGHLNKIRVYEECRNSLITSLENSSQLKRTLLSKKPKMFTIEHVDRLFPLALFQGRVLQFEQLIAAFTTMKECIDMPGRRFQWFEKEGLDWICLAVSNMKKYVQHLHEDKVDLLPIELTYAKCPSFWDAIDAHVKCLSGGEKKIAMIKSTDLFWVVGVGAYLARVTLLVSELRKHIGPLFLDSERESIGRFSVCLESELKDYRFYEAADGKEFQSNLFYD